MLDVGPAHDAERALLGGLGEGIVHALADEGHLAEDGAGLDRRGDELFAVWVDAIEIDAPLLEDEQHLAGLAGRVEDLATAAGAHGRLAADLLEFA